MCLRQDQVRGEQSALLASRHFAQILALQLRLSPPPALVAESLAQAVTAVRKEAGGKLDVELIQRNIDGIAAWVPRLGEIVTEATTVQSSGKAIEKTANEIKEDIEERVAEILALLRLDAE